MLWCPIILTQDVGVFPTCVGVFLSPEPSGMTEIGLPHVRGGVSEMNSTNKTAIASSPRAWGCFHVEP